MGRPILCLTTTHPSHNDNSNASGASTLGSGGGSMTLACPWTGSLLSSLRVAGDLAGKVPIGMQSLSLFPQDFCTAMMTPTSNHPQQLALAYGWSSSSSASASATSSSSNNSNKEDSYAMLLTIRRQTASSTSSGGTSSSNATSGSLPPIVHWKCRIPEANLTAGLLVSTCGLYIVGGGASGSLYIWKSFGGELIRTVPKAHYRSITTLTWQPTTTTRSSASNRDNVNTTTSLYLVTGGADGMVHVFSLIDLVSNHSNNKNAAAAAAAAASSSSLSTIVYPVTTWSRHYMPVTAVCSLGDRRLVTTSLDGQVLLLDLSSSSSGTTTGTASSTCSNTTSANSGGGSGGIVLATLQLPHGIQSLVMDANTQTLYAGSVQGTIYIIAWDEYAIYQVQQQHGVHVIQYNSSVVSAVGSTTNNKRQKRLQSLASSMADQVFGAAGSGANYRKTEQHSKSYQTELSGHNRAITSMALVNSSESGGRSDNNGVLLCSGDEGGTLRIWDTTSRGCIHVVNPWSSSSNGTSASSAAAAAAAASGKPGSKLAASARRRYHPITSIRVIMEDSFDNVVSNVTTTAGFAVATTSHNTMRGDKNSTSMVNLVTPLQKFPTTSMMAGQDADGDATLLLRPSHAQTKDGGDRSTLFWDVARDSSRQRLIRKRQLRQKQQQQKLNVAINRQQQQHPQQPPKHEKEDADDYRAKAMALQKELDMAQATIQRWEAVNNKLMAQLQK
jgi:WD domain, G-beta repeat